MSCPQRISFLFSSLSLANSAEIFISVISVTNWLIVRPQISKKAKQKSGAAEKICCQILADFVQKELKRG
jgi:hypothetical protein